MKINNKYIILILVVGIALVTLIFINKYDWHKKLVFNPNNTTLISTLKTKEGAVIGNMYVAYITKDVFTSLYIVKDVDGKKEVIYEIDKDGFFNTQGRDMEIVKDDFYGYQLVILADDYFVIHLRTEGGKSVSDDIIVSWNNSKKLIEVYRIPF